MCCSHQDPSGNPTRSSAWIQDHRASTRQVEGVSSLPGVPPGSLIPWPDFFISLSHWLCYYSFPHFPLFPHPPCTPQPSSIPPPQFMSMGCTCKFFEFSVSYTILDLSLSILCLLIMLLLLCTFPPLFLPSPPHWNPSMWCPFLGFCCCSSCLLSFCSYCISFLLGSFVDSCEFVVILLFIFFIFFFLHKSL